MTPIPEESWLISEALRPRRALFLFAR